MSASESADEPQVGSLARTISRNVAALMDERRVSQAQLAAAIGLQQSSVGKRLRGDTNWTANDIEAVSIAFDVSVAQLIEPARKAPARPLRSVGRVARRTGRVNAVRQAPAGEAAGSEFGCTTGPTATRASRGVRTRLTARPTGRPSSPTRGPRPRDRAALSIVRPIGEPANVA